jgi:hypothetical protein
MQHADRIQCVASERQVTHQLDTLWRAKTTQYAVAHHQASAVHSAALSQFP